MAKRKSRRGIPLTREEHRSLLERIDAGERIVTVASALGIHRGYASKLYHESKMRTRRSGAAQSQLCFAERELISRGLACGKSDAEIAAELGRHRSTVGREIGRNGGRESYRAGRAERRAERCRHRPKPSKLSLQPALRAEVQARLDDDFSPQQIAASLKLAFPEDAGMRISHETIYQALYVQSRGELRRQLAGELRTGRTKRKPRTPRDDGRGKIGDMVMLSERPAEADDRAVPGHWEGDLIVGAANSAIATLVERHSRYVMLARLGNSRKTTAVVAALTEQIEGLPAHLKRSLAWDQGKEMSDHLRFTVETGLPVYFCPPHSPWLRGSNENTNGLLRQYLPTRSDLAARSQVELDEIAAKLNRRPRETLGWKTPAEKLNDVLVASTA